MAYIEFQPGLKHAANGADISDSHECFKDAGYLLNDNDLIVDIDCLDKEVIKKMLSLFNIRTQSVWTERGVHLYFKKPTSFRGATGICSMGFPVEFKHIKNTKAITIKRNGVLRTIENEGIREEVPEFFKGNKKLSNLLGMDEGDGRNQALYEHRLKIHTLSNWKSILRFINNNIFAEPLDEKEFQVIIRDMKIEATEDNECQVAKELISKYRIVKYLNTLYFYYNDSYLDDMNIYDRLIVSELGDVKIRYIEEVKKQIDIRCPLIDKNKEFDIRLKNGILRNGEFIEVDYQEFTPYHINIEYDPKAEAVQVVDDYINHLTDNDSDYRKLLLEILAHPLVVNKEFKRMIGRFFIFFGKGGNGKGTLLTVIRHILNSKNCTGLSIKEMTDERYFVSMMGKLVNLGDDIQDEPINNVQMKVLKNISTCDFVQMRKLFKQSEDVELTTSLIFTSNHILKTFEKGESYKRRVYWCPMLNKPQKKSRKFISELTTDAALKYWIKLIVEGYFRLYQNEDFTRSEMVEKFINNVHEDNNNSRTYLKDYTEDHFINKRSPEVYTEYTIWSEENGFSPISRKLFVEAIYETFGLELKPKCINKRTARVFTKVEE